MNDVNGARKANRAKEVNGTNEAKEINDAGR